METHKTVFVNTLSQYIKAITTTCLSLYTVRLVLSALGQSDYGIYSLVAGTIAMLGFIINAMVITTQRHLSFSQGQQDINAQCKYFSNSLLIHLAVGLLLPLLLFLFQDYLCTSFFNIPDIRRNAAADVYLLMLGILFLTFLSAPFKAALISHENIVYISIVEIMDGVFKLSLAIMLLQLRSDKLVTYTIILLFIYLFEFFAYSCFAVLRYKECRPSRIIADFDKQVIAELANFTKWTTYGMGAVVIRTQGLSILLNRFFGTLINASYGIALQMYGAVSFVSSSVINAMNPILMKSEGANDHERMLRIAEKECKYVVAMMATLFIPLIVELDSLLLIWLKDVPTNTAFFCRCLLACFLIDQCTYGLNSANQAMGNINKYTLIMYTPKIAYLPIAYLMLKCSYSIEAIMYIFIAIEAVVALMRIPFLHNSANLDIAKFVSHVFGKIVPLILFMTCISWSLHQMTYPLSYIVNMVVAAFAGMIFIWLFVFTSDERQILKHITTKK